MLSAYFFSFRTFWNRQGKRLPLTMCTAVHPNILGLLTAGAILFFTFEIGVTRVPFECHGHSNASSLLITCCLKMEEENADTILWRNSVETIGGCFRTPQNSYTCYASHSRARYQFQTCGPKCFSENYLLSYNLKQWTSWNTTYLFIALQFTFSLGIWHPSNLTSNPHQWYRIRIRRGQVFFICDTGILHSVFLLLGIPWHPQWYRIRNDTGIYRNGVADDNRHDRKDHTFILKFETKIVSRD